MLNDKASLRALKKLARCVHTSAPDVKGVPPEATTETAPSLSAPQLTLVILTVRVGGTQEAVLPVLHPKVFRVVVVPSPSWPTQFEPVIHISFLSALMIADVS